jgi:hypothetical protein
MAAGAIITAAAIITVEATMGAGTEAGTTAAAPTGTAATTDNRLRGMDRRGDAEKSPSPGLSNEEIRCGATTRLL